MQKPHSPFVPQFPFPFVAEDGEASARVAIREELPGEVMPALEELLNEVQGWRNAPDGERPRDSVPPSLDDLPDEIVQHVWRTFELLREEPDFNTESAIALGLLMVSQWAERRQAQRSAVVFLQAALLMIPGNVALSYQIGRLLRKLALCDEAGAWLTYSRASAESQRDWENHGFALSGLGNLHRERGNYPEAVRYHLLALESARTHGVRRIEGDALYDLAVMSFERMEVQEGMAYVRQAILAYGPGHSQLVRLANDVAWIFMHAYAEAGFALTTFQSIEPLVYEPSFRAVLLSNIARAAAEIGAEHIYELAAAEAYSYIQAQKTEEGHAAGFAQLAFAAISAGQPERARQMAKLCRGVAERRREGYFIIEADKVLEALAHRRNWQERVEDLYLPVPNEATYEGFSEDQEERDAFAAELAGAVRARGDDAPESPMRTLILGQSASYLTRPFPRPARRRT
jgi:tetratricopeptide (TPR) repeat protein